MYFFLLNRNFRVNKFPYIKPQVKTLALPSPEPGNNGDEDSKTDNPLLNNDNSIKGITKTFDTIETKSFLNIKIMVYCIKILNKPKKIFDVGETMIVKKIVFLTNIFLLCSNKKILNAKLLIFFVIKLITRPNLK